MVGVQQSHNSCHAYQLQHRNGICFALIGLQDAGLVLEDVDDTSFDETPQPAPRYSTGSSSSSSTHVMTGGLTTTGRRIGSNSTASAGRLLNSVNSIQSTIQHISPEQLRQLTTLLWGPQGSPPASWKHGFVFNSTPGLEWGLVQLAGGPCGVLAAVQGYILTQLMDQVRLGQS